VLCVLRGSRRVRTFAGVASLGIVIAASLAVAPVYGATAGDDGPASPEVRAVWDNRKPLHIVWVNLSEQASTDLWVTEGERLVALCQNSAEQTACYGRSVTPKESVVTTVFEQPSDTARAVGTIVARRAGDAKRGLRVELACKMHDAPAEHDWLDLGEGSSEYGVNELALEVRQSADYLDRWALLPPAACGRPVWWHMTGTDLVGDAVSNSGDPAAWTDGLSDLYNFPAISDVYVRSGKSPVLDPSAAYMILKR
jgi:hypothetical protein